MSDDYKVDFCPHCGRGIRTRQINGRIWQFDLLSNPPQSHQCSAEDKGKYQADLIAKKAKKVEARSAQKNTPPPKPELPSYWMLSAERSGCRRCEAEVWKVWWKSGKETLYDDEKLTKKHRCDPAVSGVSAFGKKPNN